MVTVGRTVGVAVGGGGASTPSVGATDGAAAVMIGAGDLAAGVQAVNHKERNITSLKKRDTVCMTNPSPVGVISF